MVLWSGVFLKQHPVSALCSLLECTNLSPSDQVASENLETSVFMPTQEAWQDIHYHHWAFPCPLKIHCKSACTHITLLKPTISKKATNCVLASLTWADPYTTEILKVKNKQVYSSKAKNLVSSLPTQKKVPEEKKPAISIPPTETAFLAVSYYPGSTSLTMRPPGMTQLALLALPHQQCFKGHSNYVQLFWVLIYPLFWRLNSLFPLSHLFLKWLRLSAQGLLLSTPDHSS